MPGVRKFPRCRGDLRVEVRLPSRFNDCLTDAKLKGFSGGQISEEGMEGGMAEDGFNLLDVPWLRVRTLDGAVEDLGLLELFRRADDQNRLGRIQAKPPDERRASVRPSPQRSRLYCLQLCYFASKIIITSFQWPALPTPTEIVPLLSC